VLVELFSFVLHQWVFQQANGEIDSRLHMTFARQAWGTFCSVFAGVAMIEMIQIRCLRTISRSATLDTALDTAMLKPCADEQGFPALSASGMGAGTGNGKRPLELGGISTHRETSIELIEQPQMLQEATMTWDAESEAWSEWEANVEMRNLVGSLATAPEMPKRVKDTLLHLQTVSSPSDQQPDSFPPAQSLNVPSDSTPRSCADTLFSPSVDTLSSQYPYQALIPQTQYPEPHTQCLRTVPDTNANASCSFMTGPQTQYPQSILSTHTHDPYPAPTPAIRLPFTQPTQGGEATIPHGLAPVRPALASQASNRLKRGLPDTQLHGELVSAENLNQSAKMLLRNAPGSRRKIPLQMLEALDPDMQKLSSVNEAADLNCKEKNRLAAQRFRRRGDTYSKALAMKLGELEESAQALTHLKQQTEAQNRMLRQEMQQIHNNLLASTGAQGPSQFFTAAERYQRPLPRAVTKSEAPVLVVHLSPLSDMPTASTPS